MNFVIFNLLTTKVFLMVFLFRPVSYALTPILPFDGETWFYLFVTMHVCILLYYYVKRCSEVMSKTRGRKLFSNVNR